MKQKSIFLAMKLSYEWIFRELFFLMRLIKSKNGHDHPDLLKQYDFGSVPRSINSTYNLRLIIGYKEGREKFCLTLSSILAEQWISVTVTLSHITKSCGEFFYLSNVYVALVIQRLLVQCWLFISLFCSRRGF